MINDDDFEEMLLMTTQARLPMHYKDKNNEVENEDVFSNFILIIVIPLIIAFSIGGFWILGTILLYILGGCLILTTVVMGIIGLMSLFTKESSNDEV